MNKMKQQSYLKSENMKIIRTIESFYPYMSGPAKDAYEISKRLEKKGIKSPIYTTNIYSDGHQGYERYKGVDIFRFKNQFRFMKYCISPGIKKALKKE